MSYMFVFYLEQYVQFFVYFCLFYVGNGLDVFGVFYYQVGNEDWIDVNIQQCIISEFLVEQLVLGIVIGFKVKISFYRNYLFDGI